MTNGQPPRASQQLASSSWSVSAIDRPTDLDSAWSSLGGGAGESVHLVRDASYGTETGNGWLYHHNLRSSHGIVEVYADSTGGKIAAGFFVAAIRLISTTAADCDEAADASKALIPMSKRKSWASPLLTPSTPITLLSSTLEVLPLPSASTLL